MDKLKVCLVYFSYLDQYQDGLCGDGEWTKPEINAAFRNPKDARKWARKQRKEHKFDWRHRFSYKTLLVS